MIFTYFLRYSFCIGLNVSTYQILHGVLRSVWMGLLGCELGVDPNKLDDWDAWLPNKLKEVELDPKAGAEEAEDAPNNPPPVLPNNPPVLCPKLNPPCIENSLETTLMCQFNEDLEMRILMHILSLQGQCWWRCQVKDDLKMWTIMHKCRRKINKQDRKNAIRASFCVSVTYFLKQTRACTVFWTVKAY